MDVAYVLVHSPSVGPLTWAPVAQRLSQAIVPSLVGVTDFGAPFWPTVARTVADEIARRVPAGQPVVLVAHSNAGHFLPAIVEASPRGVAGCVFVDAALPPARDRVTPIATLEQLDLIRPLAVNGYLPPWTSWFDESEVAPMFPDPETRAAVAAEQSRLPIAYYEEVVPVPSGWDERPCGYLLFGPPYEEVAEDAAARGWPVEHIPGHHLHQLVDPDAVTEAILKIVDIRAA
jgi:hypothetical protein